MILVAFICFALLFIAWLIAPGLDRSTSPAGSLDPATDTLPAGARIKPA